MLKGKILKNGWLKTTQRCVRALLLPKQAGRQAREGQGGNGREGRGREGKGRRVRGEKRGVPLTNWVCFVLCICFFLLFVQ
mgnify:CR=1 FL=1